MEEKTIIFRIMRPDKTFYPETVTFIPGTDLSDFRESGNQVRVHQKFFEGMCNPVTNPAEQNPFGIDTKDSVWSEATEQLILEKLSQEQEFYTGKITFGNKDNAPARSYVSAWSSVNGFCLVCRRKPDLDALLKLNRDFQNSLEADGQQFVRRLTLGDSDLSDAMTYRLVADVKTSEGGAVMEAFTQFNERFDKAVSEINNRIAYAIQFTLQNPNALMNWAGNLQHYITCFEDLYQRNTVAPEFCEEKDENGADWTVRDIRRKQSYIRVGIV